MYLPDHVIGQSGWNRTDQNSGPIQAFPIWAALFSGIIYHEFGDHERTNHCDKLSPNQFPLVVKCAEAIKRPISKDRQSAIKALDVVADVAQDVQPAVVSITSVKKGFISRHTRSTGSGFIVDDKGHVITNAHVVGYHSEVFVHLPDGRSFSGRVLSVDISSDLAYIKLDVDSNLAQSLPHVPMATEFKKIRSGNFVLAIGSPLMLSNSVTVGVVSAVNRDLGHPEGLKYIQTDAMITFGNSGGPLVNLYGEVIGVNAMVAGTGVGFAIPVDQVRKFIESSSTLSARKQADNAHSSDYNTSIESSAPPGHTSSRRYLGLVMRTLTPDLAFELASRGLFHYVEIDEGVLIHAVLQNSPAHKAGLKSGDVIISIDDLPITNAQQVYAAIETREQVSITVIRQGKKMCMKNIPTEKT